MKNKKLIVLRNFVLVLAAVLAVSYSRGLAQEGEWSKRGLQGVWQVRITPRNCITGVPIPAAAFEALFTFHRGGTMSAWVQNATIHTTRGPSHGLWERVHSWSDYYFKFVHLRYSPTTGAFLGKQESDGLLGMSESGDEFITDGSTTVFDVNGDPTGAPGCSNSVGTRFKLEP